jgi:anaerobic magnesium-protoporphyrin IX monomethyl ester cyclase
VILSSAHERSSVLLAHSYYLRYDPKQSRKMKPYPPLSTLITAAVLQTEAIPFVFFDSMLSEGVEEFRDTLHAVRPRVVGILEDNFNFLTKMCTMRMREAAFEMIAAAKSSGARVVVNGSDAIDQTWAYLGAGADAIIMGEPESAFLDVIRRWTADPNADLAHVPGLALPGPASAPGSIRRTPNRRAIASLDTLPFPAWELVDVEQYRVAWTTAHGRLSWNVCTSRGCPYGCNWCAKPVFGRRYQQRSASNVADEMARLVRAVAPDHVWFADDIFGLTPRWIESFAREVRARHASIPFSMQSRADLMTPGAVSALAEARCEEVWMGVESGSQAVLDAMDKDLTLADVHEGTRRLKQHGIRACWFIQLGYPGEDWNAIVKTRDLIRSEQPDDIGVSVAYPLPGTPFYERVHADLRGKSNWSDSDDLAMMFRGAYTTDFYREIRDLLHAEVNARMPGGASIPSTFDAHWNELAQRSEAHRSEDGGTAASAIA